MNTIRGSFRAAVLLAAAASVLALAGGAKAQNSSATNNTWPYAKTHRSPVLVVVGDIASATEVPVRMRFSSRPLS